jgi:hypothetical protein
MSITDYDRTIKPHLHAAQEYAYRARREINRLPARPNFFSLTEDELADTRATLERALEEVKTAQADYLNKPIDQ